MAFARAFAPASMGNVGVGFDILGLAYNEPGDTVTARFRDEPGAVIASIEGDGGVLSHDPVKNCATVAANAYLQTINAQRGVELILCKGLPLSSGLGGSAASSVAAVVAVNALFGSPLTTEELLPACMEGEAVVSGSYHADNVAPCLFGGILLITGTSVEQIIRLPVPENLYMALVTPDVAVPTAEARAVLPKSITLHKMVTQTAGVAQLIDALHRGDVAQMAVAMEADGVVEPARAHLMPLLYEIREVAKEAGALGLVISGAGPTLCAVCDHAESAQQVAIVMRDFYAKNGIRSAARHTRVGVEGARILPEP
jgi:homoserine kinase